MFPLYSSGWKQTVVGFVVLFYLNSRDLVGPRDYSCQSWPQPLRISVNLSPVQFRHGDLVGMVHSALLESGLAAGRLEIEITESVLVDDFDRALSLVRRLKALGVHIVMDDFGTGYSALSYLTHFEVDYLKIDRVFIQDLIANPTHHAVASAIIVLAHELGMAVIAEGVENLDQKEWLISKDCDYAQGFLYSEALPAAAFAELLQQRSVMH